MQLLTSRKSYYGKGFLRNLFLQSHRRSEAGRHFWTLSCPTPSGGAGSARAGCSGPLPDKFWYFQD